MNNIKFCYKKLFEGRKIKKVPNYSGATIDLSYMNVKSQKIKSIENFPKYRVKFTHREIQILNGILEGKMNKHIAEDIGITVKTIQYHRCILLSKLNAYNTPQAIYHAFLIGLIKL